MRRTTQAFMILSMLLNSASLIFGGQISYRLNVDTPSIEMIDGQSVPAFHQGWTISPAGEPLVPRVGITLLLPPGEEAVDVQITPTERQVLPGLYYLPPAQQDYPISYGPNPPATPENPDIYGTNAYYPSSRLTDSQTYFLSGHGLGYMTVCPVEYNPVTGELAYYRQLDVIVLTEITPRAMEAQSLYRGTSKIRDRVSRKVANPEDLNMYSLDELDTPGGYKILLITADAFVEPFQEWIEFKTECGMLVLVETIEDIQTVYSGWDDAEKIRNCVIDVYQEWDNLEYVVLGGDDEFLPHRGLYFNAGPEYTDSDIAGDIYFAALDGDWDINGNHIYGEGSEADLVAELAVGRFTVDDATEIANMIYKSYLYATDPVDEDVEQALMVGEDLDWEVWGGEYKEEVRLGSNLWGYTTVGFPVSFTVGTLYDMQSVWSGTGDLLPLLNGGMHLVNHLGHSYVMYNMKLQAEQVHDGSCTNDGTNHGFYIAYSQGCYSGSFDNRDGSGNYLSDCIGEKWASIQHGAVAYVGNSRYGWGSGNNTNGASQHYDREFFDALFDEGIHRIGWTNGDSKEDAIPWVNQGVMRWCYYQVNVLGDPTLDIWTAEPEDMDPVLPTELVIEQDQVDVNVPGVEGALVAISQEDQLLGVGETDASGNVEIDLDPVPSTLDPVLFVITAHDYHFYEELVNVIAPAGPWVMLNEYQVNDITGNNNGLLDYGEAIDLDVTFGNIGNTGAQDLTAELTAFPGHIIPVNMSANIGTIPAGGTLVVEDAFSFEVNPNISDQELITLIVTIEDALDSVWTRQIQTYSHAPDLAVEHLNINGGGYDHLVPGHTETIDVTLCNDGSSTTPNGNLIVTTDSPYITVTVNQALIAAIEPGYTGTSASSYSLEVSSTCPDPGFALLYFTLDDPATPYLGTTMRRIYIGEFFNDVEDGAGEWTHMPLTGAADQWHVSGLYNHTANGDSSWRIGNPSGSAYLANMNAVLTTHEFNLAENSVLTFWYWMDAESSTSFPDSAYDGGFVEVCPDGENWVFLYPRDGYTHFIRNQSGGPFPTGTPVFSGQTDDWEQEFFNLSDFSGNVQIRFHFGSDGEVQRLGWYIDDIEILPYQLPDAPVNLTANLEWGQVNLRWQYPGTELDQPEDLYFNVYRDSVLIATEVDYHAYTDVLDTMGPGTYAYFITAQVDNDESGPSNQVSVIYNGAWVSDQDDPLLPRDYVLEQNYPNPFNPVTNLRYGVPEMSHVTIKVYNILGQEVVTLVNEVKSAGYHIVHWNAEHLASGIYFSRMESGNKAYMTKMLLLK